jgi:hypothetical protein
LTVRIIDHTQRSRFSGEICNIESYPLTGSSVFHDHMPMLNSSAARFRFSRNDFPLCLCRRNKRYQQDQKRSLKRIARRSVAKSHD